MATCVFRETKNDSTNGTSYASDAFTPAANDLLIVFVSASGTTAAGTMTDSQSGSWTKVGSALYNTSGSTLYCFARTTGVSASSMTVTFDCTGDSATGANINVYGIGGMSVYGTSAIVQSAKQENQASGGTPAPVFGASAQTGNPTLGAIGAQKAAPIVTVPGSWTEGDDSNYATPSNGIESIFRDSGFTGTTITWGGTVTAAWASFIIELAAAEAHSGTAVGTGGGVVVAAISTARFAAQTATGGGIVTTSRTGSHNALGTATGGGVVTPAITTARAAVGTATGGGVVTYTYTVGTGGESHSGTAVMTGGGVVVLTGQKGALTAALATGAGVVVLSALKGARWSEVVTGGGIAIVAASKQALGYAGLTGGGTVVIIAGSGAEAMPDFDPITTALAGRFAAAVVTPPTGYDNVKLSTGDLPEQMTPLPSVYVFPDRGAFATGGGTRTGVHGYFVRFYFNQTGDTERDMVALRKWLTVLVDQLKLSTQLGGIVSVARVETWQLGILHYAGKDYSGIELGVQIVTDEAWSAVS